MPGLQSDDAAAAVVDKSLGPWSISRQLQSLCSERWEQGRQDAVRVLVHIRLKEPLCFLIEGSILLLVIAHSMACLQYLRDKAATHLHGEVSTALGRNVPLVSFP